MDDLLLMSRRTLAKLLGVGLIAVPVASVAQTDDGGDDDDFGEENEGGPGETPDQGDVEEGPEGGPTEILDDDDDYQ